MVGDTRNELPLYVSYHLPYIFTLDHKIPSAALIPSIEDIGQRQPTTQQQVLAYRTITITVRTDYIYSLWCR